MVTTAQRNGKAIVSVNGIEIGYVVKRAASRWQMVATQTGNYANMTGLRTKADAIASLARTAK